MTRRRDKRLTQNIAYALSAIVALSMILSLIGPLLLRNAARRPPPTPTWPPTWTPTTAPTSTPAATPTSRASPDRLVFAVCGTGRENDERYRQLLQRVVDDGNAFLIHTGNTVSTPSQSSFAALRALMADFPLPFYPVPGNEDRGEDGSLTLFVTYSGAPAAHYSFDAGSAHLTVVNSAMGALNAEELAWLDADLATTAQPVKLVFTHYPPFDPDDAERVLVQGGEAFMSVVSNRGVDVVFAGHIPGYRQANRDGVQVVISGGQTPEAFYHYIQVTVDGTDTSTRVVRLDE